MTPKFNDASNFPVLNADSQADRLRGRCINWQHRHINGVVCQTDVSWNNQSRVLVYVLPCHLLAVSLLLFHCVVNTRRTL